MPKLNIGSLEARIDRLNRLVDLAAPAFILAKAYQMALVDAEQRRSPRVQEVLKIGLKLRSMPFFEENLRKVEYESNLLAAGFCVNIVATVLCKQSVAPGRNWCLSCIAIFDQEMKEDEEYEASPEGQKEMAEWEAMNEPNKEET